MHHKTLGVGGMKSYEGVAANGASLRLRRCLGIVTAAVLAAALAGSPSTASAQQSAVSRFKPLDHSGALVSQKKPLSLLTNERVKVSNR
jgi:hypothetical protein